MATIGGRPKILVLDDDGNPLKGGLVFTYEAGTTTKKTTYQDAAETTPNSNPIELDSRGEAAVYWDTGTYKVVVAHSTDSDPPTAPIWTEDNYSPSSNALTNVIVANSSNNYVNWVEVSNAVTGNHPKIKAAGDGTDSNINLTLETTGTGIIDIQDPVTIASGDLTITSGNLTMSSGDLAVTGAITGTSFGGITSANLLDKTATETVTGSWDFGGAGSLEIPNSAAPTVDADGEIAVDTTVTDFSHGVLKYYGGEECAVISVPVAQLSGLTGTEVVQYNATNDEFELNVVGTGEGKILQVQQGTLTSTATMSSATFADTGLSVSITPANTANTILIQGFINLSDTSDIPSIRIVRDSTDLLLGDTAGSRIRVTTSGGFSGGGAGMSSVAFCYVDSPSTTSATTYKIQWASPSGGQIQLNRSTTDTDSSAFIRGASCIIAMEIDNT